MAIQRFSVRADGEFIETEPSDIGSLVRYEDHLAALSEAVRPYEALRDVAMEVQDWLRENGQHASWCGVGEKYKSTATGRSYPHDGSCTCGYDHHRKELKEALSPPKGGEKV